MELTTYVHVRLSPKAGQSFVTRLQELGYSGMPDGKNTYFMLKGKSRLLIEEEASGDMVLKSFSDDFNGELAEILEKIAKKYGGDVSFEGGAKVIHVRQGQDVDQTTAMQTIHQPQQQPTNLQFQQNQSQSSNVNLDPAHYGKMMLTAMAELQKMVALDVYDLERLLTQGTRLMSALKIAGKLQGNFADVHDIQNEIAAAKKAIQNVPSQVQTWKKDWADQQVAKQLQAGVATIPAGAQHLHDASGNVTGYIDPGNNQPVMLPTPIPAHLLHGQQSPAKPQNIQGAMYDIGAGGLAVGSAQDSTSDTDLDFDV